MISRAGSSFQNLFAVLGMDIACREDALRLNFNQRPHLTTIALTAAARNGAYHWPPLFPQRTRVFSPRSVHSAVSFSARHSSIRPRCSPCPRRPGSTRSSAASHACAWKARLAVLRSCCDLHSAATSLCPDLIQQGQCLVRILHLRVGLAPIVMTGPGRPAETLTVSSVKMPSSVVLRLPVRPRCSRTTS